MMSVCRLGEQVDFSNRQCKWTVTNKYPVNRSINWRSVNGMRAQCYVYSHCCNYSETDDWQSLFAVPNRKWHWLLYWYHELESWTTRRRYLERAFRPASIIEHIQLLWPPCVADANILFYPCGFLWPPYTIGQAIIFSSCGFFFSRSFFFFIAYSQPSQIACLAYYHT